MGITKKQKESKSVSLPSRSCTKSSSSSQSSLYLFIHRAASVLISLFIFLSSALLCFLPYGWLTLIYFFKFLFTKEVEESQKGKGVVEVCVSREISTEKLNGDYCMENNIESSDEEVEEKGIIEIEKREAPFEENALFDGAKTEDILKSEDMTYTSNNRWYDLIVHM